MTTLNETKSLFLNPFMDTSVAGASPEKISEITDLSIQEIELLRNS